MEWSVHVSESSNDWPDIDLGLMEEGRSAVPAFPLDVLPPAWRDWVGDAARSAGTPVDYVAQAVLAAVAGLCGAGAAVHITPAWVEPLVLWQAVVGGLSSGRSPALAPVRRLLTRLEDEAQAADCERKTQIVIADRPLDAVAEAVRANRRGVLLWRDQPAAWVGQLASTDCAHWLQAWAAGPIALARPRAAVELDRFAVSLLDSIRADRLAETLQAGDDGLAARFLYAWPHQPAYCPLAERKLAGDDEALALLRRIARKARTADDPLVLLFDPHGVKVFDGFLSGLDADLRHAEGLEAAWLGKGRGTVARLAGVLELLAWSTTGATGPPGHLGRDQVAAAVRLWNDYFRPHARAVFDRGLPSDLNRRARRVMRWLKTGRRTEVSREDVRREALAQSVTAEGADLVLYRLTALGVLRGVAVVSSPRGGRPAQRWQVNPALAQA
jgi:hypothetical protein